jgi:hypothetical protein
VEQTPQWRLQKVRAEQVKTLEKRWAAYRKQNGLDLYGKTST